MTQLIDFIRAYPFWIFLAYVLFMLAVQALPKPDEKSGKFYVWLFAFMHLCAANVGLVKKVLEAAQPGLTDAAMKQSTPSTLEAAEATVEKAETPGTVKP